MSVDQRSNSNGQARVAGQAIREHWLLFLLEGVALNVFGVLAIAIPSISSSTTTLVLGWLFLASGTVGLATTFLARHAPGFWWSLLSAVLAILVGSVLVAHTSQDIYGGLIGWPLTVIGPMRVILLLFFLVEGGVSIAFAFEHRRQLSARWSWMLASGVVDLVLASILIFNLPGTSPWTMGLLVGMNMIIGGSSLIAMGVGGRSSHFARISRSPVA